MVLRVLMSLTCVYALASCTNSKLQGQNTTPATAPEVSSAPTPPAQSMKPTQPVPSVLPEDFSILCQNRGQVSILSSRQSVNEVGNPIQLPKSFGTLQWIRWVDPQNPQAGVVIIEGDKNPAHPQNLHLATLTDTLSLKILKTRPLFISDISDLSFQSGNLISKARYSFFHWNFKEDQVSVLPFEKNDFEKVLLLSDKKALALSSRENLWVFYDLQEKTQHSLTWTTSGLVSFYLSDSGTLYWIQKTEIVEENPQQMAAKKDPQFKFDLMSLSLIDEDNLGRPSLLHSMPLKKAKLASEPIWWTQKEKISVLFPLENIQSNSSNEIRLELGMIQTLSWSMDMKVSTKSIPYPPFIQQELSRRNLLGPQALGQFHVLNSIEETPQIFATLDLLGGILHWNPETNSARRIASYEICGDIDVASLALIQGLRKKINTDTTTAGVHP
jgi:hypothetical protein